MNSHSHPHSPYQQPHSLAFERARMARKRAARLARLQQEADQRHRAQVERDRQRRQLQQFEYERQQVEEQHRRIAEAS